MLERPVELRVQRVQVLEAIGQRRMDDHPVKFREIDRRREDQRVAAGWPEVQYLELEFAETLPDCDVFIDRGDAVRLVPTNQQKASCAGTSPTAPEEGPVVSGCPPRIDAL